MRLVDDVAPFLFDICKQVKKYMTDHPTDEGKQTSMSSRRRGELHFVKYLENRKKEIKLFMSSVKNYLLLILNLILII